jgi:Mn2+/Fe2+ NRAMP family transporter
LLRQAFIRIFKYKKKDMKQHQAEVIASYFVVIVVLVIVILTIKEVIKK